MTGAEREKRWHELAAKKDPQDLDALLAVPWPGRWQDALPRARALGERKPDPRITDALCTLFEEMRWTSRGSADLWFAALGVLEKSKSPVALARLERLQARGTTFFDHGKMEAWIGVALERMRKAGVVAAKLAADGDVRAASAESRQVDADALVEKGDPRGEFITLQNARADGRATRASIARERALLKQHEKTWLGGLAAVARKGTTIWERGVLVECWLDNKTGTVKRATGDPALAHVRRLGFNGVSVTTKPEDLAALLTHPVLGALRLIVRLPGFSLQRALQRVEKPLAFEAASADYWDEALDEVARTMPRLVEIGAIYRWADGPDEPLLGSPLWNRVTTVSMLHAYQTMATWIEALRKHPSKTIRRLRIQSSSEYNDPTERGSLVYDVASRTIDLTIDKWARLGSITAPKGSVKLVRARWLSGEPDRAALARDLKRLGAKLEIVELTTPTPGA